ncbi:MAG: hypothetical protein H0W83_07310 [Planctomycetes bacterium]|nr:hypothetical protein [Planctomycetota bacterium]
MIAPFHLRHRWRDAIRTQDVGDLSSRSQEQHRPPMPHDTRDFETLMIETQAAVRAHIAGMGVPTSDVDDVAQEVYLDAWAQRGREPADVEPLRWLRGMARNCALEYFRRRCRQARQHRRIADLLIATETPPAPISSGQLGALQACLSKLERGHRELIERRYCNAVSAAELAMDSGKTSGAMHMLLSRLRDWLRRCVLESAT